MILTKYDWAQLKRQPKQKPRTTVDSNITKRIQKMRDSGLLYRQIQEQLKDEGITMSYDRIRRASNQGREL